MTLVELRYLTALAEEQHFGRAAAKCCVSQPALSIAVKKLEDELGVTLFERSKSQVRLTALGELVGAQAEKVLKSAETIQAIADAGSNQLGSPLTVGGNFTIAPYLLPEVSTHLNKLAPHMTLRIREGKTGDLRRQLRDGSLDAIVVCAPFVEADVVSQELFREPLVVLLPRHHALSSQKELRPTDLVDQKVLLPAELLPEEGHCLREHILAVCAHLDEPEGVTSGASLAMLRNMVSHDLGILILPLSAAVDLCRGLNHLVTRPFATPIPERRLLLAWRASFPRHKAIDVLRGALQSCSAAYGYYTTDWEPRSPGLLVENSRW